MDALRSVLWVQEKLNYRTKPGRYALIISGTQSCTLYLRSSDSFCTRISTSRVVKPFLPIAWRDNDIVYESWTQPWRISTAIYTNKAGKSGVLGCSLTCMRQTNFISSASLCWSSWVRESEVRSAIRWPSVVKGFLTCKDFLERLYGYSFPR